MDHARSGKASDVKSDFANMIIIVTFVEICCKKEAIGHNEC